jgi:hypothetical protein
MVVTNSRAVAFDTDRIEADMAVKGWLRSDLAARANVSPMTVTRFMRGEFQTARTAKKLAKALGRSVRHYLLTGKAA